MVYKIAVVGAHSCGKTTFAYQKAVELKMEDKSVAIIIEQARLCPFELKTKEAAEWLILSQILAEKTAEKGHEYIICDRTAYDSVIYAAVNDINISDYIARLAFDHLDTYEEVIHLSPSRPIVNDGFRDIDEEYRARVAAGFVDAFGKGVPYHKKGEQPEEEQPEEQFLTITRYGGEPSVTIAFSFIRAVIDLGKSFGSIVFATKREGKELQEIRGSICPKELEAYFLYEKERDND